MLGYEYARAPLREVNRGAGTCRAGASDYNVIDVYGCSHNYGRDIPLAEGRVAGNVDQSGGLSRGLGLANQFLTS